MTNQNQPIIALQAVNKNFADIKAVSDVSLDIYPGEITGLLGVNGAGKTTLINLMLGRLQADSGTLSINRFAPGSWQARSEIGAILQSTALPEKLKVREQVALFSSYYPSPLNLNQVLDIAGLTELANRYFDSLSGGQKQRVFFALAICGRPKVVFLDEPTVGLDAQSRREFWTCMKQLAKQGTSILLTTHYLQEADELADRIYLLHEGKVSHSGTPDSLKNSFTSKQIRFKSESAIGDFKALNGVEELTKVGDYIQLQSSKAEDTMRHIFSQGLSVKDLTVEQMSLEDAFIKLTHDSSSSNQGVTA